MPESDLYPAVQDWLDAAFPLVRRGNWFESYRKSLITANLDWISGGPWMRPDLALVHVHRRRFDPAPRLDLYTFEVKPADSQALAGLHQTLAHGRFADFVVFALPARSGPITEIEAQAARFGVGLVTFEDVKDWSSFRMMVEPVRGAPDPDLREQFLSAALQASHCLEEVLGWLHGGAS